jgi:hypothetical protein
VLKFESLQLVSADVSFLARIFSFKLSASRLAAAILSWMSFAAVAADCCCDIFQAWRRGRMRKDEETKKGGKKT